MTKKEQPKSNKRSLKRWLVIAMWAVTLTGVLGLTLLFTLARFEVLGPMPTFDVLENPQTNLATEIYAADGVLLGTYFVENRTHLTFEELFPLNRDKWLTIKGHELPPIVAALIATEDLRFFEHSGIDFQATARAGIKTVLIPYDNSRNLEDIDPVVTENVRFVPCKKVSEVLAAALCPVDAPSPKTVRKAKATKEPDILASIRNSEDTVPATVR